MRAGGPAAQDLGRCCACLAAGAGALASVGSPALPGRLLGATGTAAPGRRLAPHRPSVEPLVSVRLGVLRALGC